MSRHIIGNPLAFCSPLSLLLFCSLFVPPYLLGTLLAVIGSVHLVPRLLINWSFHFPPLAHIHLIPKSPPPWGFPDLNIHSLGQHCEAGPQDLAHYEPLHVICLWALCHSTRSGYAPEAIVRNHASNKIPIVSHEYLQAQTLYPCAHGHVLFQVFKCHACGHGYKWAIVQNLLMLYGLEHRIWPCTMEHST